MKPGRWEVTLDGKPHVIELVAKKKGVPPDHFSVDGQKRYVGAGLLKRAFAIGDHRVTLVSSYRTRFWRDLARNVLGGLISGTATTHGVYAYELKIDGSSLGSWVTDQWGEARVGRGLVGNEPRLAPSSDGWLFVPSGQTIPNTDEFNKARDEERM
ncbi:MAG TPA: hypothetical protein VET90_03785, partial [Candidatus Binatus sp.]|nr:hypothetical protein [Candidatus Binatus sp.]